VLILWQVVDHRSARLSNSELHIGSEEVIAVDSEHGSLARFGSDEQFSDADEFDDEAFTDYIAELKLLIRNLQRSDKQDLSWIEDQLQTEVHLFYEARDEENESSQIKIWSVRPTLQNLLRLGPSECLDHRPRQPIDVKAVSAISGMAPSRKRTRSPSRFRAPRRQQTAPDVVEASVTRPVGDSVARGDVVKAPDVAKERDNYFAEAPRNPPQIIVDSPESHVQQPVQAVEFHRPLEFANTRDTGMKLKRTPSERRVSAPLLSNERIPTIRFNSPPKSPESPGRAQSSSTSNFMAEIPSLVVTPPDASVILPLALKTAVATKTASETIAKIFDDAEPTKQTIPSTLDTPQTQAKVEDIAWVDPFIASRSQNGPDDSEPTWQAPNERRGRSHSAISDLRPLNSSANLVESRENVPIKKKHFRVPDARTQRFRWVHIPCNSMLLVQRTFETIAEELKKPRMFESLLRPQAWAFKKNTARHDSPHATFMKPHFQVLYPSLTSSNAYVAHESPIPDVQMFVYVSISNLYVSKNFIADGNRSPICTGTVSLDS
jgi:hypothetical protein